MNIFEELTAKIKGTNKKIVFPEGEDKRVLGACVRLKKDGLLTPIVLGNVEEIKKTAKELNVCIDDIEIISNVLVYMSCIYDCLYFFYYIKF